MQIPKRRPGQYQSCRNDRHITQKRYNELKKQLAKHLQNRPVLIEELRHLGSMGDFSENAAYQIAKGQLRALNEKILKIEDTLKHAKIIKFEKNNNCVKLGNLVTLKNVDKIVTYQILGAIESNPSKGIISHLSPLGAALMNKSVGETLIIKNTKYTIIKID